ncbi:amidohydrolase 2 [Bradyrhizobium sacchari]|uniref:6-methylsalicylate decarboxylase n=1 Tax=Bradyrhizobium sacchari TaxID=1399419 RepID=A0A560JAI8_9BRAD|nr:amidohydrolase family protein [Bradyrhizobium sacchari]OPY94095.1 amidohydrolase 2 [Bradyrhizobium sacchari]TWB49362.1 putative TIM-barrel fold metal-dependent hydrolase [Bradyrhizobium sacchari]TWB68192.1 putative TIM-barrel fold metal-dependent hydrolase [Bradyrhizobium sacchari]
MKSVAGGFEVQWIDVHAHFMIPHTEDELKRSATARCERCFLAPELYQWTADAAIAHMDANGIAMQMLSNIPKSLKALQRSNEHGASIVARYPSRFGLLLALPTDDADACLTEIGRTNELKADGYAATCCYNDVYLSDPRLEPVWEELQRREATVFVHPDAYAEPSMGRPTALLEVAFETTRTVVDMLYAGIFRRYPKIKFVIAHCGAALPALAGRLLLLGTESWVPNPQGITKAEMKAQLAALYLDTAATGSANSLAPALAMTTADHLIYGSDCGVLCSSEATMQENLQSLREFPGLTKREIDHIGRAALKLFPSIARRLQPVCEAVE